jgi:hypothetical protein
MTFRVTVAEPTMTWRPIKEYGSLMASPTDETGPLVLARTEDRAPMLVVYRKGHFVICPGVPMWYGNQQFGFMTADHVVEFMEIPS